MGHRSKPLFIGLEDRGAENDALPVTLTQLRIELHFHIDSLWPSAAQPFTNGREDSPFMPPNPIAGWLGFNP